jgi:hypothetical protein
MVEEVATAAAEEAGDGQGGPKSVLELFLPTYLVQIFFSGVQFFGVQCF